MFTEKQVREKLQPFIEKYKDFESKYRKPRNLFDKEADRPVVGSPPEYWPGYNDAIEQHDSIASHFIRGKYPEKAFRFRAPQQTAYEQEYMRNNFKSVTLGPGRDMKNTIMRGMNRNNWQLKFEDQAKEFKEYVESGVPHFGSIQEFWELVICDIFLQDANGIIVTRPEKMDYLRDETDKVILDAEGFAQFDNSEINPVPYYFSSANIVGQQMNEWYLCMTPEKSLVQFGNGNERSGIVLEFYEPDCIWRIEQTGKKINWTFNVTQYYPHNQNYLPKKLGGDSVFTEYRGWFYNSVFNSVVDLLDEVAIDEMTLFLIKKKSGFPIRIAVSDKCTHEEKGNICNDGKIWDAVKGANSLCGNCKGQGYISRITAAGDVLIKPGDGMLQSGDEGLKGEYVKYVSPSTDTLEFLRKEMEIKMNEARKQIHLRSADQQATGGVDSATGVLDEMKAMQAFIRPIIYQLFALLDHLLLGVSKMKFAQPERKYTLVPPTDFDISTPEEYLGAIKLARESGSSSIIIQQLMEMYLRSVEFPDAIMEQAFTLLMASDDLFTLTPDQIAIEVAGGVYQPWQRYLHGSGLQLIYRLYAENGGFFEQDPKQQQEQLNEIAQRSIPAPVNVNPLRIIEAANA